MTLDRRQPFPEPRRASRRWSPGWSGWRAAWLFASRVTAAARAADVWFCSSGKRLRRADQDNRAYLSGDREDNRVYTSVRRSRVDSRTACPGRRPSESLLPARRRSQGPGRSREHAGRRQLIREAASVEALLVGQARAPRLIAICARSDQLVDEDSHDATVTQCSLCSGASCVDRRHAGRSRASGAAVVGPFGAPTPMKPDSA